MNKAFFYILFFSLALSNAANVYGQKIDSQPRNQTAAQNRDVAEQVKKAFASVRRGNLNELEKLKQMGEAVIPYLEPYLSDASVDVRTETVDLAIKIGGAKSLNLIAKALRNSNSQIQKSTAYSVWIYNSRYRKYLASKEALPTGEFTQYESFSPEKIASNQELGNGLRDIIKSGNADVAAVFLLANFPGGETETVLTKLREKKISPANKKSASDATEVILAAEMVLANAGDQEAIQSLSKTAGGNNIESLKFLLANISEIESPVILSILAKTLDNKTYIEGKLPSDKLVQKHKLPKGSWIDPLPPRRLCDLAVNSFVEKFNLNVNFTLHTTTYIETQITEVRRLVNLKFN